MAEYYSKNLKDAFEKFRQSVEKDMAEIRRQKAEMQRMMIEFEHIAQGKYLRDDKRIVISAPEIVIGNVDFNGILRGDQPYSKVLIRTNELDMEASSPAGSLGEGSITQRASLITTLAVDPGIDGKENVLTKTSAIIQQARSISLNTNDAGEMFTMSFAIPENGIVLNSDSIVSISAMPSVVVQADRIKTTKATLGETKERLKEAVAAKKKDVEEIMQKIDDCYDRHSDIANSDDLCSTNMLEINDTNEELDELQRAVEPEMVEYFTLISEMAEVGRQTKALEAMAKEVASKKSGFKNETTGARVSIAGEIIDLVSVDGDGNFRTNPEASVNIQAQSVNIETTNEDSALMADGNVWINSRTIELTTADNKVKDENNQENPAVGEINITSRNINVEGVDYETKDGERSMKRLTKDGKMKLSIENMEFNAVDKEGKAVGRFDVNAKAIEIKSIDVDKDTMKDKKVAAGGSMVLLSEKMWNGAKSGDLVSKEIQVATGKIAIIASETAEIQQKEALLQMDSGKLSMASNVNAVYGDVCVNGKTELKDEMKAVKASVDNLEAKTSFKSKSISDGIAVPVVPSSAKLTAKLNSEDAPEVGG